MDIASENIAQWIFKRTIKSDLGKISMSPQVLDILMKLDGSRTVSAVAKEADVTMMAMRKLLTKLQHHQLIEPVEKAEKGLDPLFLEQLQTHLAEAIGPVAGMVITDTLKNLGLSTEYLPKSKAQQLVDQLAARIPVDHDQQNFRNVMAEAITAAFP